MCHYWATGCPIKSHTGLTGKLVFWQQAAGEQEGVAFQGALSARNGSACTVYLGQRHSLHPLLAQNAYHCAREPKGDVKVFQTLHYISFEAAGVGHELGNACHLGALQREAARHDKADVARAQDEHFAARHEAFHVHQPLSCAGGIDARGPIAGDEERAARTLPAPHGKHYGSRLNNLHPLGAGSHNLEV